MESPGSGVYRGRRENEVTNDNCHLQAEEAYAKIDQEYCARGGGKSKQDSTNDRGPHYVQK